MANRKLHVIVEYTGVQGSELICHSQFRDSNAVTITSRKNTLLDSSDEESAAETTVVWILRQPAGGALYFRDPLISIYDATDVTKRNDIRTSAVNPDGVTHVFPDAPTVKGQPGKPSCKKLFLNVANIKPKGDPITTYLYSLYINYKPTGGAEKPLVLDPCLENMGEF